MPIYKPILYLLRKGIIDQEFYGTIQRYKCNFKMSEQEQHPFFMRSLLKPIQASVLEDNEVHRYFNLTNEEIAVCCSSHTAQDYHIKLVSSILNKIGLDESYLKCGVHPPIAKRQDKRNTAIHNNCSGRHAAMLALCVQNGWDTSNYTDFFHPVQKAILNKLIELSDYKRPIPTFDGCGAPVWAVPMDNIAEAFFELFGSHPLITNAMRGYPLILGGENRLDTKIMLQNKQLIAKVGAGGFLMVYNTEFNEMILIKMAHDDNYHREMIASIALTQLEWIEHPLAETVLENSNNQVVGMYKPTFKL